jgi:hypothetical protein
LPDFSWYNIPKREKNAKETQNITNYHTICQMATKHAWPQNIPNNQPYNITNNHKILQMAIK